jgi:hypothetical protein
VSYNELLLMRPSQTHPRVWQTLPTGGLDLLTQLPVLLPAERETALNVLSLQGIRRGNQWKPTIPDPAAIRRSGRPESRHGNTDTSTAVLTCLDHAV